MSVVSEGLAHTTGVCLGIINSHDFDTIIYCRGKEFKAEKAVLIAASAYFKELLASKSNTEIEKIYMDSFQPEPLMQSLEFIYNNRVELNERNIKAIMQTAQQLEITILYKTCISYFQSKLNFENFLETWNIADMNSDDELRSAVVNYCVENYVRLRNQKTFLTLSRQRLQKIIQDPNLNANPEQILETVIEWIRVGQPEKQEEMTDLLYILRSDIASKHYLQRLNQESTLLQDMPALRKLLVTTLQGRESRKSDDFPAYYYASSFLDAVRKPPLILAFIENEKKETEMQMCQLDGENASRRPHLAPFDVRHSGTVVYFDRIYCAGGRSFYNHQTPFLNTFCSYDAIEAELKPLAFMTFPRAQLALAVHEGNIFAVGGYNTDGDLADVEKYCIEDDSWTVVSPMATSRRGVACVSFAGKLYAIGGRRNREILSTVEYYTTRANQWTKVASLLYPRTNCCVTFMNNKLYVIGGFWSIRELIKSSVGNIQVYSHDEERWYISASLKTQSLITSVFSWQEKIYLFSTSGYVLVYTPSDNLIDRLRRVSFSNGLVRHAFPIPNKNGNAAVLKRLVSIQSSGSTNSGSYSKEDDDMVFEMEETKL